MVRMMGLPDIKPDTAIAGDQNGFSCHIDKYNVVILLYSIQIQSYTFFQASALMNDDASKEADGSSPTDATKGTIRPYYVGFESTSYYD